METASVCRNRCVEHLLGRWLGCLVETELVERVGTAAYGSAASRVAAQFVDDHCSLTDKDNYESTRTLYKAYEEFCEENGYKKMAISRFTQEVLRACPQVERSRRRRDKQLTRGLKGITLND